MGDFVVGVLTTAFCGGVAYAVRRLYQVAVRKGVHAGVPLYNATALVVAGGFQREGRGWEGELFVHEETVLAASLLTPVFQRFRTNQRFIVDKKTTDEPADLEICLGGPAANDRTKAYLTIAREAGLLGGELQFRAREAWIVKVTSPSSDSRTVILLFGTDAFDTVSAVSYFVRNLDRLARHELRAPNASIKLRTEPKLGARHARIQPA